MGDANHTSRKCEAYEDVYKTYVLTDRLGEFDFDAWPDPVPRLHDTSWVSYAHLYPMGLLQIAAASGILDKVRFAKSGLADVVNPSEKTRRDWNLEKYFQFYRSWGFKLGGEPPYKVKHIKKGEGRQALHDRRVIGFHLFTDRKTVWKYAKQWELNLEIRDHSLATHHLIVSRAIDLVCSELLANGFDHCGSGFDPKVFILANILSPISAKVALDEHEQSNHLTETELYYYRQAVDLNGELLQICVGNIGQGFAGNDQLRRLFEDSHPMIEGAKLSPAQLIQFALEGHVSTKTKKQVTEGMAADEKDYIPDIHGLAEVGRIVARAGGTWRIHSNATYVDIAPNTDVAKVGELGQHGTPIQGCLHYINIPLWPIDSADKPHLDRSKQLPQLDSVDSNNQITFVPAKGAEKSDEWGIHIRAEIRRLARAEASSGIMVVDIGHWSGAPDGELQDQAAVIVREMFLLRNQFIFILLGGDERSKSIMSRFAIHRQVYGENWILPFVSTTRGINKLQMSYVGSQKLEHFRPWLEALLSGHVESLDDFEPEFQPNQILQKRLAENNPKLFTLIQHSGLEKRLAKNFSTHVLLTSAEGRLATFYNRDSLLDLLIDHRAIATATPEVRFWHLGAFVSCYLHLGRVWADPLFRSQATSWALGEYKRIIAKSASNRDVVCVALLHPAIELLHELLRSLDAECANGQSPNSKTPGIVEIHRVAEIRWDFPALRRIAGTKVVCFSDVRQSGRTLRDMRAALTFLNCEVLGTITLLTIGRPDQEGEIPIEESEAAFCHWDSEFYEEAKSKSPSKEDEQGIRVVDVDSQFTQFVPAQNRLSLDGGDVEHDQRLLEMIGRGCLRFGHWDANGRHSSFIVYLREWYLGKSVWNQEQKDQVRSFAKKSWEKAFGTTRPDVVLYPGNSTAVYLVHVVADAFKDDEESPLVIMAVPAHREYGTMQLLFESSSEQRRRLRQAKNFLFFDDSFSTGTTEKLCIAAIFEGEYSPPLEMTNIQWLTFVTVGRGFHGVKKMRSQETWVSNNKRVRVEIERQHYVHVGPVSVNPAECALCAAEDRLRRGDEWGAGARPSTQVVLSRLRGIAEVRGIEERIRQDIAIPSAACEAILKWCGTNIGEACLELYMDHAAFSKDEWLAAALFLGLYYSDTRAYFSRPMVCEMLTKCVAKVLSGLDGAESNIAEDVLLLATSMLPASEMQMIVPCIINTVSLEPSREASDLPAAMFAIAAASLYRELRAVPITNEKEKDEFINRSLARFKERILERLPDGCPADFRTLLTADLTRLCHPPRKDSAAWLAQTMSGLLSYGRHPFFLHSRIHQLEMTGKGDEAAKSDLLQVMDLCLRLTSVLALQSLHLGTQKLIEEVKQCDNTNRLCDLFREFYDSVWAGIVQAHLLDTSEVARIARDCVNTSGRAGMRGFSPQSAEIIESHGAGNWQMLTPRHETFKLHIQNLIDNPIDHCGAAWDFDTVEKSAFIVVWLHPRVETKMFEFVVLDQGVLADRGALYVKTGLYNAKLQLGLVDGELRYEEFEKWELKNEFQSLAGSVGIHGDFKNVFTTAVPLMPKVRPAEQA